MKHFTRFTALFCALMCVLPRAAQAAVPTAPTNFAATAGNKQVNLSWNAVAGATSYVVFRRTGGATSYNIVAQPTSNGFTDTPSTQMQPGVAYLYIVRARNASGDSPNSAQINCTPAPSLPPANPTATVGDGQISLSWTYSPGAASYNVYHATSATATPTLLGSTTGISSTSYVHTGLTNGSSHFYVVRSVNVGVESANSTQVSGALPTLAAPASLTATPGESLVALSWSGVTGAKSYSVERRAGGTAVSSIKSVAIVSAPQTSYTDSGNDLDGFHPLINGQGYLYQIRAQNAGGVSVPSPPKGAIPREKQKVDALVRSVSPLASGFAGDTIYNDTGEAQVGGQVVPGETSAIYGVQVQCEGSESATYSITGPTGGNGWSVSYFDAQNNDITPQVTSTQGWPVPILVLGQTYEIGVQVTPLEDLVGNTPLTMLVRATASSQPDKRDTVQIITTRLKPGPDVWIRNADEDETLSSGNDIYNGSGTGQSRAQLTVPNTPAVYILKVQNDDDSAAHSFKVSAPIDANGWSARYFDAASGGNPITNDVTGAGWTLTLNALQERDLRMEVTPDESAGATSNQELKVTVARAEDATKKDVVKTTTSLQKIGGMEVSFNYQPFEPLSKYTGPNGVGMPDVQQYGVVGFRGVRANPNAPWPKSPRFKPIWSAQGKTYIGEEVWIHFPKASETDSAGEGVTVECGNQLTATIHVVSEQP